MRLPAFCAYYAWDYGEEWEGENYEVSTDYQQFIGE